jgi:hypothetical protein
MSRDLENLGAADAGDAPGGPQASPPALRCRATVHLPGGPHEPSLRPGDVVDVDPRSQFIQDCLRAQTLVPLPARFQPGSA